MISLKFNKEKYLFFFFLKCTIILIKIRNILLETCEYDTPLIKNNQCIAGICTTEQFENNVCTINNTLIKTQWFNNISPVSLIGYTYVDITTTLNGNLLTAFSSHPKENNTIFYGLKKDGRSYFKKNNIETPNYFITKSANKFESFSFTIKLNGTNDNKEYFVSIPKDCGNNIELYDFENNIVYEKRAKEFFNKLQIFCIYSSIIKLSTDEDYYILGISGTLFSSSGVASYYFYLYKLLFTSPDIKNNSPIIKSVSTSSTNTRISSCFESNSKKIICFYQNTSLYYVIGVYDYDLNNKVLYNLVEGPKEEFMFFKGIHFIGDVGAFGYYLYDNSKYNFYIQIKEYKETEKTFYDYFTSIPLIKIDQAETFSNKTILSDMIKIADSKICFCSFEENLKKLYVIIIYNYNNQNIKIRYYYSNIYNLYNYASPNEFEISLYNDLIAFATSLRYQNNYNYRKSYLIIFSYPNSTDFNVSITDNLKSFTNIYIDPKEYCFIDNNLFGYIFYGVKIINYSEGYELLSKNNNTNINKEDILINDDQIELVLSKKINFPQNGKIEYAMVLTEPDYDIFNQYSPIIDTSYCDGDGTDEESIFKENKNKYVGKTSYINIIINSEEISNNCNENCDICLNNNNKTCITCKFSYKIINEEKQCLSNNTNETESMITIPKTTQPITTIPKTTQPITIIPKTTQPITTMPKTTQPITTIPKTTQPITTMPKTTQLKIDNSINIKENNNSCSYLEIINNNCISEKITINQLNEVKSILINLNYTKNKTNILIFTKNIIIQLSTLEDQQNSDNFDVSNIDLGKCEQLLKEEYKIPNTESLIIYKTDNRSKDLSSTYVQYEVYSPINLEKLNLSICNNVQIIINVPIILNNNIEVLFDSLSQSGYNIFNDDDSFYHDNCAIYTTSNKIGKILSNRNKDNHPEIQKHFKCQVGCKLRSYNHTSKKAKCACSLTNESIELNARKLFSQKEKHQSFYNILSNSNFQVLKCYKLLFGFWSIKNIGEILMTVIFVIFLIIIIISSFIWPKKISNHIKNILENKYAINKIKIKMNIQKTNTQNYNQCKRYKSSGQSNIFLNINSKKYKKKKR